jgi:SAM-dependent methyltransferase
MLTKKDVALTDRRAGSTPRAIVVHSLDQARAALAAAAEKQIPITLLSPEGAAGALGPAGFAALIAAARASHPEVRATAILDCGDATGFALAALRHGGVDAIRIEASREVRDKLRDIAVQSGADLDETDWERLDLLDVADPAAACRNWLAS